MLRTDIIERSGPTKQKREQKLSLLSNGIFNQFFIVSTIRRQTEFVGKMRPNINFDL